ncbi:MAG TPA: pyruvate, phosphate dikinase [Myxococcales bacterium]|nr:pyruvate, phosphate dikinase [Myxococcales bacterium]
MTSRSSPQPRRGAPRRARAHSPRPRAAPRARGTPFVYAFHQVAQAERRAGDWEGVRALLGGKGANLAEMTRLGLPVPPGFTVTTQACNAFLAASGEFPPGLWEQVLAAVKALEARSGKTLGDPENPLLVSCRSGAKFSMPGMMDTVLNIGLNEEVARGLQRLTGDERFAFDAYRRLVQMFATVVLGVPDEPFEAALAARRARQNVGNDADLRPEDLRELTSEFKRIVRDRTGTEFPEQPLEQLRLAIRAVFRSWEGKRARDYRKAAGIADDLGTAVNIVTMVFGNMGQSSGTGVATTRNVTTGEPHLEGDYLINAQGEDVVSGTRATLPIADLEKAMPAAHAELLAIGRRLERHFRDVQDVEFTIERGKLWMLQTRNAKRTAQAAIRIAVDLANEKQISRAEAIRRITPDHVDYFLHPQFDPASRRQAKEQGALLASGLNVSPGAAQGQIAFDADTAERWAKKEKRRVIMVRPETKPDDVHGMLAADGVLTSRGGRTSHAALVARQFGKPAVVGALAIEIDLEARTMAAPGGRVLREGDVISIDGTTGEVFAGSLRTVVPDLEDPSLLTLLGWADQVRRLGVWANADYPQDAQRARAFGAQGLGLCRTEHMFFQTERLPIVQRMILSKDPAEQAQCLKLLLAFQRKDFDGLFRAMDGLPVTIRLIDPPLHEFLPDHDALEREVVALETRLQLDSGSPAELGDLLKEKRKVLEAVEGLREQNPMLGLRGVRLGIHMPELVRMQVRAIFEAACACARDGVEVHPKVMIPLSVDAAELKFERAILEEEAAKVMAEQGRTVRYQFGTMVEIPRAALVADRLAEHAEFFSFGTNDLTQTTFGISRDDAETGFLTEYLQKGILQENPFATLDQIGVGELMKTAVRLGRGKRKQLELGICGEHGGDPRSIAFCHRIGLDYVSCSPFRVPVARLAAAHAALEDEKKK